MWLLRRQMVVAGLVLGLALLAPTGISGQSIEAEVRAVARQLRCVVCDNQSVAESNAELAAQMRGVIREQLAAGRSPDQIVRYFVERYGETILHVPSRQGFALIAWWIPIGALAVGAAAAGVFWYRQLRTGQPPAPSGADADLPAVSGVEVAEYRERLDRELAPEKATGVRGGSHDS